MAGKTGRRLQRLFAALALCLHILGTDRHTVTDAWGHERSFVTVNDIVQRISRQVLTGGENRSGAIRECTDQTRVSELDNALSRVDLAPAFRTFLVPVVPAAARTALPDGLHLMLGPPIDTSPVVPFHLDSKK